MSITLLLLAMIDAAMGLYCLWLAVFIFEEHWAKVGALTLGALLAANFVALI